MDVVRGGGDVGTGKFVKSLLDFGGLLIGCIQQTGGLFLFSPCLVLSWRRRGRADGMHQKRERKHEQKVSGFHFKDATNVAWAPSSRNAIIVACPIHSP